VHDDVGSAEKRVTFVAGSSPESPMADEQRRVSGTRLAVQVKFLRKPLAVRADLFRS
jgi:hypothetical protein